MAGLGEEEWTNRCYGNQSSQNGGKGKGKRRPCSRVAMATQILEASFEDQNHTLPTYKEVPRTSQDSLLSRLPNGMGQFLLIPPLTSQTFWGHKGLYFAGEEG